MDRELKAMLSHCTTLLDTHNADFEDIEENTANYLVQKQIKDPKMISFIMDIMKGCIHYQPILNVVLKSYFATSGKHVRNPEISTYVVLTYLYLFELDQLTVPQFMKLAGSIDPINMHKFFEFAFKTEAITTWMKDGWCQVYDEEFVDQHILGPLLGYLPELHAWLNQLREKVNNKVLPQKKEIPNTVPEPFNLTKPRPRKFPVPEIIPKTGNAHPVPESMYKEPLVKKRLEKDKLENKISAKKKTWLVDNLTLPCANTQMSGRTYLKIKNIEGERQAKLQFDKKKAIPMPSFQEPKSIKMTKAAILREGQLHLKKEEAEMRKWEELESGTRDMSPFVQWQTSMKDRDRMEQLNEVESLRLKAKISHEDAILSKQKLKESNRQLVQDIKQEADRMMQIFLRQQLEEEEQSKKVVLTIAQAHKKTKDAKKNMTEYKRKIVEEMHRENQQLMADALEQAEAEMRKRLEMINEIRAMAAMTANRQQKLIDLSQTANFGLLSEMSLIELKERLVLMKNEKQRQLDQKRDEILASKQASEDLVLDTLDIIFKHRNEQSASRKNQSRERKPMKPEILDEKVLSLQQELAQKKSKRQEQQNLNSVKAGAKKINDNYTFFTKMQNERMRFKRMEISREKTAQQQQQQKLSHELSFRTAVK